LSAWPEEGPNGASRMEPELSGASPVKPGSSGASLMDRQRSIGSAEQSTQVGGSQPVEPKDTKPIRAGRLATRRAGVQAADASRGLCAGAARGSSASESWRAATGGAGGRSTGCTALPLHPHAGLELDAVPRRGEHLNPCPPPLRYAHETRSMSSQRSLSAEPPVILDALVDLRNLSGR